MSDEIKEADQWGNEDNANYYEKVPVEIFRHYAVIGGFENGCDIDLIYAYIKDTQSLLDVGAGYGRALNHLITNGYSGHLFAIERSLNFYNHLVSTFKDSATIIHGDIQDFNFNRKFDVVLWLWSNISEWPKAQQPSILKILSDWCNQDGFLILDTISHNAVPANVTSYSSQIYIAETDYGCVYGYTPKKEEVKEYADLLGLKVIAQFDYITSTERNRVLHVLKK